MTKKKKIIIGGLLILGVWGISQAKFTYDVLSYKPSSEAAEAVVVFTGGPERLNKAKELYEKTSSEKMFITSVGNGYKKVEDENVIIDTSATTTKENAEETAKFARKHRIKKVKLVTAAYHMPRSIKELERAAPDVVIVPHAVYPPNFRKETWYKTSKSLKFLFLENLKYRYVQVIYGVKGKK